MTNQICLTLDERLLKEVDEYRKMHFYESRTELIRDALRRLIEQPMLSPETLLDIRDAREQIRRGEYVEHEKAMKEAGL